MIAFLLSGYTFFFRWPVARVERFHPASILLGPFLQPLVFLAAAVPLSFLSRAPLGLAAFSGFVFLSALSGFFHDDGFADTADSLGVSKFDDSPEVLERIHAAMKDSRLGSFGVSALVLLWIVRAAACFHWGLDWPTAAIVVLASRGSAFGAAALVGRILPAANGVRGGHLMGRIPGYCYIAYVVSLFAALAAASAAFTASRLLIGPPWDGGSGLSALPVFATWLGAAAVFGVVQLAGLARRSAGLSGDLIGACVCSCEILITLLAVCKLP